MIFTSDRPEDIAFELRQLSTQALFLNHEEQRSLAGDLQDIFSSGEEDGELAGGTSAPEAETQKLAYVHNARDIAADNVEQLERRLSPELLDVLSTVLEKLDNDPETGIKQATCFARYLLGDLAWESLLERAAGSSQSQVVQEALSKDALERVRSGQIRSFGDYKPE